MTNQERNQMIFPMFFRVKNKKCIASSEKQRIYCADISCACKIIKKRGKNMNNYYGIPKQLYHTYHQPLDASRSSSLKSVPTFSNNLHTPSISRIESSTPILLLQKNNLAGSQISQHQEFKPKLQTHDYYGKAAGSQEGIIQIQQRLQQLSKKVLRNSQDIKLLKSKQDDKGIKQEVINKFQKQVQRIEQKQAVSSEQYCLKIVSLKQEILELKTKIGYQQRESSDRSAKSDDKLLIKVRNILEDRVKQETAKIRLIIDNEISKLVHDLKWIEEKQVIQKNIRSKLKYPYKSLKISITEFIEAGYQNQDDIKGKGRLSTRGSSESPRSPRVILSQERIYYIDKDGFLLDEQNYYLTDENENMIKLDEKMIGELKKQGLLRDNKS